MMSLPDFPISKKTVEEYELKLPLLIQKVDKRMTRIVTSTPLIGDASLSMMYDNHTNHARFMVTVLSMQDFAMLYNTLPWVLKSYSARGFSFTYFTTVLEVWIYIITQELSSFAANEIVPVYQWLLQILPEIEKRERETEEPEIKETKIKKDSLSIEKAELHTSTPQDGNENEPGEEMQNGVYAKLLETMQKALLSGDSQKALELITREKDSGESLKNIYLQILRPSMYAIGDLWEKGVITVAHEHLATSIVMRIITQLFSSQIIHKRKKGRILVTAASNEYHEVGARMLADLLEIEGWDVTYLGANIPEEEIALLLAEKPFDIICISVTMSFNLTQTEKLLESIRRTPNYAETPVIVGGRAFSITTKAHEMFSGAIIALTVSKTIEIADNWYENNIQK